MRPTNRQTDARDPLPSDHFSLSPSLCFRPRRRLLAEVEKLDASIKEENTEARALLQEVSDTSILAETTCPPSCRPER